MQNDNLDGLAKKQASAERLRLYKITLEEQGFVRIAAWCSPQLIKHLNAATAPGECRGRTLERLLVGIVAERPWPLV